MVGVSCSVIIRSIKPSSISPDSFIAVWKASRCFFRDFGSILISLPLRKKSDMPLPGLSFKISSSVIPYSRAIVCRVSFSSSTICVLETGEEDSSSFPDVSTFIATTAYCFSVNLFSTADDTTPSIFLNPFSKLVIPPEKYFLGITSCVTESISSFM